MSHTTITLLFLVFTIISFILEKIPLGLTASICAIGLTITGVLDVSNVFTVRKQQRNPLRRNVRSRTGTI